MAIAVSQAYVVQVVNSSIAVYTKKGALVAGFPKSLSAFFPGSSGDLGDPRAFYDWRNGRFVVVADDFTNGEIRLAASATHNPTGSWHINTLNVWGPANCRVSNSVCPDFPQLGFGHDGTIYLGLNVFDAGGNVSDYMLLLPKAQIYAGAAFGFNFWFNLSWGGVLVDTVQPVTMLSAAETPRAGFAVQSFNINFGGIQCQTGCNGVVVWSFSNNLQTTGSPGPVFGAVLVPTANNYFFPASANEPGCAFCIDTGDVRISGTPVYHAGVISASLNTNGSDGHSHTLWFQLQPQLNDNGDGHCTGAFLNACPTVSAAQLLNEDCFFCGGQGTNGSSFYGTLAPNDAGDLTMVYGYSDDNTNPESAYTSRRVTQTLNRMHDAGFVLCGGASQYFQGRWGDYTAAVGDISSGIVNWFWFSAMNSIAGGNWGTCIGRNGFLGPNQI